MTLNETLEVISFPFVSNDGGKNSKFTNLINLGEQIHKCPEITEITFMQHNPEEMVNVCCEFDDSPTSYSAVITYFNDMMGEEDLFNFSMLECGLCQPA